MLVATGCVLALGACGGDDEPAAGPDAPAEQTQAPVTGSRERCEDVIVPGHEAVDVRAAGTSCSAAEEVAAAAEGRGRAPYESGGFECEPSDASGGNTTYRCSMGDATVTFLCGTL